MASTDFGSASAGQGATCGTDLAWARTVTNHDHQLFQLHFVRRAPMNMGACVAAWSLLAVWTGSRARDSADRGCLQVLRTLLASAPRTNTIC